MKFFLEVDDFDSLENRYPEYITRYPIAVDCDVFDVFSQLPRYRSGYDQKGEELPARPRIICFLNDDDAPRGKHYVCRGMIRYPYCGASSAAER